MEPEKPTENGPTENLPEADQLTGNEATADVPGTAGSAAEAAQETQPVAPVAAAAASAAPVAAPAAAAAAPEEPAKPVKRRRRSRHARSQIVVFMNFMLSLLLLAAVAASALFYFGKIEFDSKGPTEQETTFLVKRGAGITEVSNSLEAREIISNGRVFRYGVRAYGQEDKLKAGEYAIPAGASMRDVMHILTSGKSIMYGLTVPEGLTVKQVFDRIAANEILVGPMPSQLPAEGSLFTDTLHFTRGTTRVELVDRMIASQKKLVAEAWAARQPDLPVRDINEFVTLASIVEKETGIAAERPHVASVFVNRLNKGMRLQSDPTIIYGLFGGAGKPSDRPIFKSDIEKPTPYNTYVINGLPPAPIANPGKAALEAVANPLASKDLYFVADGTGGHVFAETLKEHNDNVRKWRAVEQNNPAATGKPTAQ